MDYGFSVIISTSFADIFYNNCFKNGLLPIVLSQSDIDKIVDLINTKNSLIKIDLQNQMISFENYEITFEIDKRRKKVLLEGIDDISETLILKNKIKEYESKKILITPWLFDE